MKLTDEMIEKLDKMSIKTLDDIVLTLRAYTVIRKLNSKIRGGKL